MAASKPVRTPMAAGNWKMHLTHQQAIALVQKIAFGVPPERTAAVETVLIPPFTALRSVQTCLDGDRLPLLLGAQDLSRHSEGAHTGDVAGSMLAALGCRYVVVGHSERRAEHHEDDEVVHAKVVAAYANTLTPIVCVGEDEQVREAGDHVAHCTAQLAAAVAGLPPGQLARLVVAYEPIWAIGSGQTATGDDAQEMAAALRAALADVDAAAAAQARVLYGGSVKAENAAEVLAGPDVEGALVGGAALEAAGFGGIVAALAAKGGSAAGG